MIERLYSTTTVVQKCGVTVRQLYYWELIGLVQPRYETFGTRRFRRYTQENLQLLKRAKSLLDEGYTLQAVRERLHAAPEGGDFMKQDASVNFPTSKAG